MLGYPTRWWRGGAPPVTSFSGESARGAGAAARSAASSPSARRFSCGAARSTRSAASIRASSSSTRRSISAGGSRLPAGAWSAARRRRHACRRRLDRRDWSTVYPTSCAAVSATSRSTRAGARPPRRASSSSPLAFAAVPRVEGLAAAGMPRACAGSRRRISTRSPPLRRPCPREGSAVRSRRPCPPTLVEVADGSRDLRHREQGGLGDRAGTARAWRTGRRAGGGRSGRAPGRPLPQRRRPVAVGAAGTPRARSCVLPDERRQSERMGVHDDRVGNEPSSRALLLPLAELTVLAAGQRGTR